MEEKDYSLIFCRRIAAKDAAKFEILLGMKKRGFGCGKWNGFGGKVLHCTLLLENRFNCRAVLK